MRQWAVSVTFTNVFILFLDYSLPSCSKVHKQWNIITTYRGGSQDMTVFLHLSNFRENVMTVGHTCTRYYHARLQALPSVSGFRDPALILSELRHDESMVIRKGRLRFIQGFFAKDGLIKPNSWEWTVTCWLRASTEKKWRSFRKWI